MSREYVLSGHRSVVDLEGMIVKIDHAVFSPMVG